MAAGAVLLGLACSPGASRLPAPQRGLGAPARPAPSAPSTRRPALLFASPDGAVSLDLNYLRELREHGFDVDFTEDFAELSEARVRPFDVLVFWISPDAEGVRRGQATDPARVADFRRLVDAHLHAGGGVLLMPEETNLRKQRLAELYERWGAIVPAERIVESDPTRRGAMPNASYTVALARTSALEATELAAGVREVWYPTHPAFLGATTMPLQLDESWRVVLRAGPSTETRPIDLEQSLDAASGLLQRATPQRNPPLLATRSVGRGRVALMAEWPQFSFGSGTKAIFARTILEHGVKGVPSDFGVLLENTLRWLAASSRRERAGDARLASADRLSYPPIAPQVRASFAAAPAAYDASALARVQLPAGRRLYRGLIGASTVGPGGPFAADQFAQAARRAGIDFVVFLEPLELTDEARLAELAADCKRLSGPDLLLLPGLSVDTNLGTRMFLFARDPAWPPRALLGGPRASILQLQRQRDGAFDGYAVPFGDWLIRSYGYDAPNPWADGAPGQVGYFEFRAASSRMRMQDARLYGAAAVRVYRSERLIEDNLEDYLITAAGTLPPAPFAVHEVHTPASLFRAAKRGVGLTYVVASGLEPAPRAGVLNEGLRWSTTYESLPVFASSGPAILAWPRTHRTLTYGAEGFSPERSLMRLPLALAAEAGLSELSIYDGPALFRRFALDGAKSYEQTLLLDGSLQRDLVLVVRDRRGGVAVSAAARSWAEGSLGPVFCGDRINDCGAMRLARGPWSLPLIRPPSLPVSDAGRTWDGGPHETLSALGAQRTLPVLETAQGAPFHTERLASVPILEFADEEAVGVQSLRSAEYAPSLQQVVNPWHTFGPVQQKAAALENRQRYRQWAQPSHGPPPYGFAGTGLRRGVVSALFTDELSFREARALASLALASFERVPGATLLVRRAADGSTVEQPMAGSAAFELTLDTNDALAVYGAAPLSTQILVNRGGALRLRGAADVELLAAASGFRFERGESYVFEVAAHAFPAGAITSAPEIRAYLDYIAAPSGLQIARGERSASGGLLELRAADGGVELAASQVAGPRALPLRVLGLNPRWSAGVYQLEGYSPGFYGSGSGRYRSLAVDADGAAYLPLHVALASYRVVAGHPLVADARGADLFLQVTCLGGAPMRWHVSVNNPGPRRVTTTLRQALALPGLDFAERAVTLGPGEYRVLQ